MAMGATRVLASGRGTSLVPQTLKEMRATPPSKGSANLKEENARRRRALDGIGVPSFDAHLQANGLDALRREPAAILQVNVGLYCNQACSHCHVESSPLRTEMLSDQVAERIVQLVRASPGVSTVDLTGGAPEINNCFRYLVEECRGMGLEVIDRCNLTVLQEPDQDDLDRFLANHGVHVVASLPCYSASNVDQQRGYGVFERSIDGIRKLNEMGYGKEGTGLVLDLVYNPVGAFLPPSQSALESAYKQELLDAYGIVFNNLITITNMPIKRFADYLHQKGEMQSYMQLLLDNFNVKAVHGVMCKDLVSVGWDGQIYDCDFNQQLGMGMQGRKTVFDIDSLDELTGQRIRTGNHCFGCTAGQGSSCSGATL